MEEKLNKVSDTDVGREMRDEAVDPDVGNGEAEYGDCEVNNDPTPDENNDGAVARLTPLGCPASLDAEGEGLKILWYVCGNDDDAENEAGPKAALEKLLRELSASELLEVRVE